MDTHPGLHRTAGRSADVTATDTDTDTDTATDTDTDTATATIHVHWIPLGAGQHVVRICGKAYERLVARWRRRRPAALYHSALTIDAPSGRWVVEMTPVPDGSGVVRGVVATGAVGSRWLGRMRVFRYEIRCWRGGEIPDVDAASATIHVAVEPALARRLIDLAASVPTPVWGRDDMRTGEMWNSNSVTAWLLATAGLDVTAMGPPPGGRAPGWDAGIGVAERRPLANASAAGPEVV